MRLGADPEVFLKNKAALVSVVGKVDGNKWNPWQVPDLPKGFTLQQDNVALEFGIPPAANKTEFIRHIQTVKAAGKKYLKGLSYSTESCAIFPKSEMNTAEAHVFGCEPDFNAWTHKENNKPTPPHPHMRSAGGHIHVETTLDKEAVVRAMDCRIGITSVLMDNGEDRRQLYGKAGAYRPKPYGVEYRTPSNWWIFNARLIGWVWDETSKALAAVAGGDMFLDTTIRECIDNNDKHLAQKLVKQYNLRVL